MRITLTENAIKEIKRIVAEQAEEGQDLKLRVAIKGGGCSGFQWKLELDPETPGEKDTVIEQDGVKVVVDPRSAVYVDGTTVDFINDLNRMGFVCKNDAIKTTCGCGSSFSM